MKLQRRSLDRQMNQKIDQEKSTACGPAMGSFMEYYSMAERWLM